MPSGSNETLHWLLLALEVGVGALPDVMEAAAAASGVLISLVASSDTDSPSSDTLSLSVALASRSCPLSLPPLSTEGFDCAIEERPERTWAQVLFLAIITFPESTTTRLLSRG